MLNLDGITPELFGKLFQDAKSTLEAVEAGDHNVNDMYNVMRYAKAGLYQPKSDTHLGVLLTLALVKSDDDMAKHYILRYAKQGLLEMNF